MDTTPHRFEVLTTPAGERYAAELNGSGYAGPGGHIVRAHGPLAGDLPADEIRALLDDADQDHARQTAAAIAAAGAR